MVNRERYCRGAHTVAELKYHCVWETKYRYPVLRGGIGLRLRGVLRMIGVEQGMTLVQGNIRPNHVHLLVSAPIHLSSVRSPRNKSSNISSSKMMRIPVLSRFGMKRNRPTRSLKSDSSEDLQMTLVVIGVHALNNLPALAGSH